MSEPSPDPMALDADAEELLASPGAGESDGRAASSYRIQKSKRKEPPKVW